MNRFATAALALSLVAGSASANVMDMVRLAPGSDGREQVRLRMQGETAPGVEQVVKALRAQGKTDATSASVSRMLASPDRQLVPCGGAGDCQELAFDYAPAQPPTLSKSYNSGGITKKFGGMLVGLLVGLLSLFSGASSSTAMAATPNLGSFNGNFNNVPAFNTSLTNTGIGRSNGTFGIPTFDTTSGTGINTGRTNTTGASQASAANGQSFFRNLPLPSGSWAVRNNGHFYDCRADCGRPHHGLDLRAPNGTPVFAVADGIFLRKKDSGSSSYHEHLIIHHEGTRSSGGQPYNTLYGHISISSELSQVPFSDDLLSQRIAVRAGQQIGTISSDHVSFAHLHFEVLVHTQGHWKGTPVDPDKYADFHPDGNHGTRYAGNPPLGRNFV